MQWLPYGSTVRKHTVSRTPTGDLYAESQSSNASQVAEPALAEASTARISDKFRAEISQDLAAYNAYVDRHGSPTEMLREHLANHDDAP
jgi:post-segregation antitoxin (ccd killing protein)